VPGRLVVGRIPDLNPKDGQGQDQLFDTWRFHAFSTTTDPDVLDTAADKTHRAHAIIENVHADLKDPPWRTCPGQVRRERRRARPGRPRVQPHPDSRHPDRSAAGPRDHRHHPPHPGTVPARTPASARRLRLYRLTNWPWQRAWKRQFATVCGPPLHATT